MLPVTEEETRALWDDYIPTAPVLPVSITAEVYDAAMRRAADRHDRAERTRERVRDAWL